MNKTVLLTVALVLPLGLIGGGAATWIWVQRHEEVGHAAARAARGDESHAGHDHAGATDAAAHDEHGEHAEGRVELSEEAIRQFGVQVAAAGGGTLDRTLKLPAEIALNADRVAHIVPRVAGMVREVCKSVGEQVEAGELMAVLESRELAEAKAADLAAEARLKLAENSFKRIDELVAQKISPQKAYDEARQNLEAARIAHRETIAKLHALGLDHDEVAKVSDERETDFGRYEIRAPFTGAVVDRHITLGEVHDSRSAVFVVADLSTVWVDIAVYSQDVGSVRAGAKVRVTAPGATGEPACAEGTIHYVSPIIDEATRTGLARAAIRNDSGLWKPGLFVTAEVVVGEDEVACRVPNEAIQRIDNQSVVFVEDEPGCFEKRPIAVGRSNESWTEVVSGLKAGEKYVTKGAFVLKAELGKETGGHEH